MKPPLREVSNNNFNEPIEARTDATTYPVYITTNEAPKMDPEPILTQESNPYKPERVKKILQEVTIGPDTTQEHIFRSRNQKLDCSYLYCWKGMSQLEW